MNKLVYEEWKEKYCAKISQDQLDNLKNIHAVEDPQSLIENSNLEAYEFYKNMNTVEDPQKRPIILTDMEIEAIMVALIELNTLHCQEEHYSHILRSLLVRAKD